MNWTKRLQRPGSPIDQKGTINTSVQFNWHNKRSAIDASRVKYISADQIAAGTVIVSLNVGSTSGGYLLIDGPNNRILVNDGTTNRIVIGSV